MELKKSPKANLEGKRMLFIQLGLIISIGISLVAFEWKTYEKQAGSLGDLVIELEEEIIPITERDKPKPPPPPPPPPEVIQIVEDEVELEEELEVEETETDENEVIEIEEEEESDEVVNFMIVEDKPVFPGCEDASKAEAMLCFQKGIIKHIQDNFRYPEIAREMGVQGKVFISFVINKSGDITNVTVARSIDKHLDKEAQRLVTSIPKMIPAKQRGKPTSVSYSVPINFQIQ
jgi:protein TonB